MVTDVTECSNEDSLEAMGRTQDQGWGKNGASTPVHRLAGKVAESYVHQPWMSAVMCRYAVNDTAGDMPPWSRICCLEIAKTFHIFASSSPCISDLLQY